MHYGQPSTHPSSLRFDSSRKRYPFCRVKTSGIVFSMCRALYVPMRVLRLADQKVAAMDKVHFYVCQTDANMSYYLTKVVADSGRCTHDETLRLMYACLQDDNVDEVDSDGEDEEESVVEDDVDKEVTSNGKESGEDGSDEDDDLAGAFTSDAIGAGRGQLRQVTPSILYIFLVVQTNILLSFQIFCTFVSIPRRSDGSCSYEILDQAARQSHT
jgi:hypothetical protein